MADTRGLLERISTFRHRLEQLPGLPEPQPTLAVALPALKPDEPATAALTNRARRLLEDARGLIAEQRRQSADPLLSIAAESDPLARFHRGTVGLTDAAVRLVQSFPTQAGPQIRLCDGLEQLLAAVRDRLAVFDHAAGLRKTNSERQAKLAGLLRQLFDGERMGIAPFAELADAILDEARAGFPYRPLSCESDDIAQHVAAHALTVAQVVARLVPYDYEWSGRPQGPVVAALVMDLGMLAVPGDVFTSSKKLSAEAKRAVEVHPRVSAEKLAKVLPEAATLFEAVVCHHEKLEGTGYPNGIRGESVPPLGRFLAACNTYAAMTSDRPHRPALCPRTALTDILMLAEDGLLDRDFCEYLLHMGFYPVGTVVELTDGRLATVAATHPGRAGVRATTRPVVAVLADDAGQPLPRPQVLDLAAADRGGIARTLPRAERAAKLGEAYPDLC
jgi:HD-GYP domain-containing protein (c-di-GMP phosphodiesterase class II)